MNQEKIMKRKMYIAIAISIILAIALCVFIGLYIDEKKKNQIAYKNQYMENLTQTYEEINIYLEKGTDYEKHYNMILSDMGTARSMVFLINDYSSYRQNIINELHYCFVMYPQQMSEKLEEISKAVEDITENLDKGYEDAEKIVDSIDKKGF